MATVRGCHFPEDRLYDVPHHVWYLALPGGLIRAGITPVGVALAREVLIFTPKRVGRPVEAGRAMATVESAKWVGSVRAGFAARVEAVNEALAKGAGAVNRDCYGDGWLMLLRPDAEAWSGGLTPGAEVGPVYAGWMEREGFDGCGAAGDL